MDTFTTLLSLLGQQGLIPAIIPSIVFVIATVTLLNPFLKFVSFIQQQNLAEPIVILGLMVVIPVIIISYVITALNTFILKIFEGYIIIPPLRFLYKSSRKKHMEKARDLIIERDALENQIRQLETEYRQSLDQDRDIHDLLEDHYQVTAYYNMSYPQNPDDVLPTRFGNTLKAAENYPGERYGFDGVQLWPRLVEVIPEAYKSNIDATRSELSFLVYMSFLSAVFSVISLSAFFYSTLDFKSVIQPNYLIVAFISLYSCRFFYNASIFSLGSFCLMMRSSYDLFKIDLLKKLGMEEPKDSIDEFKIWRNLNELIVLGSHSLSFVIADYRKLKSNPRNIRFKATGNALDASVTNNLEAALRTTTRNNVLEDKLLKDELAAKFSASVENLGKHMEVTEEFYKVLTEYTKSLKTFLTHTRKIQIRRNRNL